VSHTVHDHGHVVYHVNNKLMCCSSVVVRVACRYAVSQRAQLLGQAAGLPPFMALFSFIGELAAAEQHQARRTCLCRCFGISSAQPSAVSD
jgi:cytosine/uracil/thiamine/allantoin permease